MQQQYAFNWRALLRIGLLAGIAIVYVSVIGMLESFNEREVIDGWFTLGQVLLFAPPVIAGYLAARRADGLIGIVNGVIAGAITSVPVLIFLLITQTIDVRPVFVNVNRNLIEILTLDSDEVFTGGLILAGMLTVAGGVGAVVRLIPAKVRNALITGVAVTLVIAAMSELVRQILGQFLDRDTMRSILNRDVLLPAPAAVIFIVSTAIALGWLYRGDVIRERYGALPPSQRRYTQFGGFTALGIVLLLLPWVLGTFLSEVFTNVGLYMLMGLGLNIAVGLAGLLDLGYVTNFAVGAYITALLTSTGPLGAGGEVFNFWLVLPVSIIAAMITGFLLAVPVLRMRGDYLAIATLGFGEIIELLAKSDWLRPLIGGAQGILAIPKPQLFGITFNDPQQLYYVILAACLLMVFISLRLNNSRTGRQWMAIREDEDVASAMGIDTSRAKLLAFTLSAASGGLAGAIFAAKVGTVFPDSFDLLVSINVLSLIIVGGMGSIPGIALGAFVLIGLPDLLREFDDFRLLIYGALLVVMMLSRPEGLWPSAVHRREMRSEEEDIGFPPQVEDRSRVTAKTEKPTVSTSPGD